MSAQSVAMREAEIGRIFDLIGTGEINEIVVRDEQDNTGMKYWFESIMEAAGSDCVDPKLALEVNGQHVRLVITMPKETNDD